MCTLSLFRQSSGFKIVMNRDERHDRTPELPPQIINPKNGIFGPIDPVSKGTWIAKNDNGFWGCLLNGYFENDYPIPKNIISRGTILPTLLADDNPIEAAHNFNPKDYLSFRLLVGSRDDFILYEWDGSTYKTINFHASYQDRMFFLSSSSWRQDDVIACRKQIFEEWIENGLHHHDDDEIPAFHLSTKPATESAPMMKRSYSSTKSITVLNINQSESDMHYYPVHNQAITSIQHKREYA